MMSLCVCEMLRVTQRKRKQSADVTPKMPALIIYKSAPEIFPIEQVSAKYIRRDGCRKIFVRCSGNVLRPNTNRGKQKPT